MGLVFIKFLACIYDGRSEILLVADKTDHFCQRTHAIDFELIDHSRLPRILFRYNQSLEMFSSGSDGYRERTLDGLKRSIKAQFAYKHKFLEMRFWHIAVCPQDAYSKGQVETAAFFSEIGRSQIDGDVGYRKLETAILQGC